MHSVQGINTIQELDQTNPRISQTASKVATHKSRN